LETKRSAKRINNVLNVLSKIVRYAIDFFTFEELEALVAKSADEPVA
jgi:hypothetical protein